MNSRAEPPAGTAADAATVTLKDLREGQRAVIVRVGGGGSLRRRLLEMGLRSGTAIHVEKYAPLRDPLELVVNDCHVSLRVSEAARITVEPEDPAG